MTVAAVLLVLSIGIWVHDRRMNREWDKIELVSHAFLRAVFLLLTLLVMAAVTKHMMHSQNVVIQVVLISMFCAGAIFNYLSIYMLMGRILKRFGVYTAARNKLRKMWR